MPALQLPYLREPAERKGKRLFRKQLLPLGEVHHPVHDKLHFSRDRLAAIVEAFRGGAHDMVPFVLASDKSAHPDDPERVRGEVKGLELADDGLYGLIEAGDDAAELIEKHPRFPVSVRLADPQDGRFSEALAHVAATADAVIRGMKPWEALEAARDTDVLDLSGGSFSNRSISKDADTQGTDALSDEEKGTLRSLFEKIVGKSEGDPSSDPKADKKDAADKEEPGKKDDAELSDEDVERVLAQILKDEETEEAGKDTEPVAAALTDEDRQKLDMANERTKRFELKAGKSEIESRLSGYVKEGVPPTMVEASRALLTADESTVIDFANERESDTAKKVFEALDKAKGTIDFSERGSSLAEEANTDEQKEARETAEAAVKAWSGS